MKTSLELIRNRLGTNNIFFHIRVAGTPVPAASINGDMLLAFTRNAEL